MSGYSSIAQHLLLVSNAMYFRIFPDLHALVSYVHFSLMESLKDQNPSYGLTIDRLKVIDFLTKKGKCCRHIKTIPKINFKELSLVGDNSDLELSLEESDSSDYEIERYQKRPKSVKIIISGPEDEDCDDEIKRNNKVLKPKQISAAVKRHRHGDNRRFGQFSDEVDNVKNGLSEGHKFKNHQVVSEPVKIIISGPDDWHDDNGSERNSEIPEPVEIIISDADDSSICSSYYDDDDDVNDNDDHDNASESDTTPQGHPVGTEYSLGTAPGYEYPVPTASDTLRPTGRNLGSSTKNRGKTKPDKALDEDWTKGGEKSFKNLGKFDELVENYWVDYSDLETITECDSEEELEEERETRRWLGYDDDHHDDKGKDDDDDDADDDGSTFSHDLSDSYISKGDHSDSDCRSEEVETKISHLHGNGSKIAHLHGNGTKTAHLHGDVTKITQPQGNGTQTTHIHGDVTKITHLLGNGAIITHLHGNGTKTTYIHGNAGANIPLNDDDPSEPRKDEQSDDSSVILPALSETSSIIDWDYVDVDQLFCKDYQRDPLDIDIVSTSSCPYDTDWLPSMGTVCTCSDQLCEFIVGEGEKEENHPNNCQVMFSLHFSWIGRAYVIGKKNHFFQHSFLEKKNNKSNFSRNLLENARFFFQTYLENVSFF